MQHHTETKWRKKSKKEERRKEDSDLDDFDGEFE